MKTASFEFKCRRCGTIDQNPHASENNGLMALIWVIFSPGTPPPITGAVLDRYSIHSCEDGGKGVSDLIGYAVTDK